MSESDIKRAKGYEQIGNLPETIDGSWDQLFSIIDAVYESVADSLVLIQQGQNEEALKILSQQVSYGLGGITGIAYRLKKETALRAMSDQEYVEHLGRQEIMKLPPEERDRILKDEAEAKVRQGLKDQFLPENDAPSRQTPGDLDIDYAPHSIRISLPLPAGHATAVVNPQIWEEARSTWSEQEAARYCLSEYGQARSFHSRPASAQETHDAWDKWLKENA